MNDLTELLVFTSARTALKDPEFLSGELWINSRARQWLRKESALIREPIPWRREISKEKVHLATIVDDNKTLEKFLREKERQSEKSYTLISYNTLGVDHYRWAVDITNQTFSTSYSYYANYDYHWTTVTNSSTWGSNSFMSTINYYTIDSEEEFGSVPKNLYLLPVGSVSGIREEKKEQMENDGLICTRCGKKITRIPKSFSRGPSIGMCMDCALFVEKEQRKLPIDEEILYEGDRYPNGWRRRGKDLRFGERNYEDPWWLSL